MRFGYDGYGRRADNSVAGRRAHAACMSVVTSPKNAWGQHRSSHAVGGVPTARDGYDGAVMCYPGEHSGCVVRMTTAITGLLDCKR